MKNLNIFIEGGGISKEIGNESLDEILDLDNIYTKEKGFKFNPFSKSAPYSDTRMKPWLKNRTGGFR